jgi:hypothetical protein
MPAEKAETSARVPGVMDKCLRLSKKIIDMLRRKSKSTAEAYFAARLVGIFFEEKYGIKITPEQEETIRQSIRKDGELQEEDSG